ncbi:TetR/AcrR family transcriptional regulator [Actinacidiphila glaucinigra]|uniref:TetR/AcrR family transcriptional regulator n=1 Tax=Actinacidiphila glaucinigra TaxID=235986 RepID=UPI00366B8A75
MPKVSEEHLRARRAQILDAAARCFARAGFHRTTIQDIAAESGFSAGLIYRYFADKDDMVVAIAEGWHDQQARRLHLDGPAGNLAGNPADAFPDVAGGYLELLRSLAGSGERQRVQLGVQIWAEALREPRVHAVAREGVDRPRAVVTDLVRAAQERGELDAAWPADGLARVFVAIYQGLALQTAWDPELDNAGYVAAVERLIGALAP